MFQWLGELGDPEQVHAASAIDKYRLYRPVRITAFQLTVNNDK